MGRVQVVLDDNVEKLLRNHCKKKGDMSEIMNEALRKHLVTEK